MKTALLCLCFFLLLCPHAFAAPAGSTLPLDSSVYSDLNKLSSLGYFDSTLMGMRPYARTEVARQAAALRQRLEHQSPPAVVFELLARIEREVKDELAVINGAACPSYFKPIRSLALSYRHQDAEPSFIAGSGIVARQVGLNYNNDGIDYGDGSNGLLTLQGEAGFGGLLHLEYRPYLYTSEDSDTLRLLTGRLALALGPIEVSAGRQSLWWGQGAHGSLVLTNNAKPLDMVRVTNPTPVLLPWVFRYLGPFRFDAFWSKLEDDRVVPEPYFAGLRLNIKPLPWLELGASRAVMFGGEGRPDIDLDEFVTILGGKNLSGGEGDTSNSVAALDFRIKIPDFLGAELYGEVGGEDEAGHFIANKAYIGGLYLGKVEPSGRVSLRFEYADLSFIDNNSPPWYRHGIYRSGYSYKKQIMGHHAGGGAKDWFSEIEVFLPHDLTLSLSLDYEKRGYDQPVRETHLQPSLRLAKTLQENSRIEVGYTLDLVDNFGFVAGDDREFSLGYVNLSANF